MTAPRGAGSLTPMIGSGASATPAPEERWPRALLAVLALLPPLLGLVFEPDGLRHDVLHQARSLLAIWIYVMALGVSIQIATDALLARRPALLAGRLGALGHVALAALLAVAVALALAIPLVAVCPGLEGRIGLLALRGALLAGVYVIAGRLYRSMRRARDLAVASRAEAERSLAEARYAALVSRTQPHFLHNALAAAAGLLPRDPSAAEALLRDLGSLFREIVQSSERETIRAEDELETARRYLAVQRARFGERLAFDVERSELARDALVPPLVLLPFVENAVVHGLSDGAPLRVWVRLALEEDHVRFEVEDDGPGLEGSAHDRGTGVGSRDARARLATLYGDAASVSMEAARPGAARPGVRVVVRIPREDG